MSANGTGCNDVRLFTGVSAKGTGCNDVRLFTGVSAKGTGCNDVRLFTGVSAKGTGCNDVRLFTGVSAKGTGCNDVRLFTGVSAKGTGCNDVRLFAGVSATHRTYSSTRAMLKACPPSAHHVTRVSMTTTAAATVPGPEPAARPSLRHHANQPTPLRHTTLSRRGHMVRTTSR